MKKLKILSILLFGILAFACKKDNNIEKDDDFTKNLIFYLNTPNNSDGLLIEAKDTSSNGIIYYYGSSNSEGKIDKIQSIVYKRNKESDTLINFVLDKQKRPYLIFLSKKSNGENLNYITKIEYLNNDSIKLNLYNYNWTTQQDSLIAQYICNDSSITQTYGNARIADEIDDIKKQGDEIVKGFMKLLPPLIATVFTGSLFLLAGFAIAPAAFAAIITTSVFVLASPPKYTINTNLNVPASPTAVGAIIPKPIGTPENPNGLPSTGTVTDIDGNAYKTIKIGDQIWMAENLKTSKYNDGTEIPNVIDDEEWETLTEGAYTYYNKDANHNATYGKLYNWHAVNTGKLCPQGWHIPTDAEWTQLINYLGEDEAGQKMKSTGNSTDGTGLWDKDLGYEGTNESGFSGLPGGHRYGDGSYGMGAYGGWWSSTEGGTDLAWGMLLFYDYNEVDSEEYNKNYGFSCRCARD